MAAQVDDDYYYGDGGFTESDITTLDGSPWILIATVVFCCSLYCFLPCVVACLNTFDRKKRQDGTTAASTPDEVFVIPTAVVVEGGQASNAGKLIGTVSLLQALPFRRAMRSV
jgi:hypothetical protein